MSVEQKRAALLVVLFGVAASVGGLLTLYFGLMANWPACVLIAALTVASAVKAVLAYQRFTRPYRP